MTITVGKPVITGDGQLKVSFPISGASLSELFYNLNGVSERHVSRTLDAALIALLVPAMRIGQDIALDGAVSAELHYRVSRYIIPLLSKCIPGAVPISIHAPHLVATDPSSPKIVLSGLSGGVDSFHVAALHLKDDVPKSMRVTHFVFHHTGSHGSSSDPISAGLFQERLEQARIRAREMDRPLIVVTSNLDRFDPGQWEQSHTLRSSAVAFLLSGTSARFLYASTVAYSGIRIAPTSDISHIDPILLPLLMSERCDCFSVGASTTRVEKTAIVAAFEPANRHLDVCVNTSSNCSQCWKCARTLATLEINGNLERFSSVFDLKCYARVRDRYFAHILVTRQFNPLVSEIYEEALSRGYSFSAKQKMLAMAGFPIHFLWRRRLLPRGAGLYLRLLHFPPNR